ncbi:MAG: Crp/Fnr family transcriptional regulator, partial [Chlorobiales bacterium]|nr:Crp/Fnr family transcriptional regulator [Chlorobiales bacterium]
VEHSDYQSFDTGTRFYARGDDCPGITFLISGEIRVFMAAKSKREITLYHVLPGEVCVLNASCILARCNYMANAVAIDHGAMLYLSREAFLQLMASSEEMRNFIFSFFSQRFAEIIELVEEVTFGKLDVRLADYLVEKAENNELNTTHQVIANELGSSREVISRLLKDFERKGRIELSRHFIRIRALY